MATSGAGRALLLRGPNIGGKINSSSVLNPLARNKSLLVPTKNAELAAYSTTVFQTPKLGQQTKPISETLDRKLSAAPGVALDHEIEEEMRIDIRTEVPGKTSDFYNFVSTHFYIISIITCFISGIECTKVPKEISKNPTNFLLLVDPI